MSVLLTCIRTVRACIVWRERELLMLLYYHTSTSRLMLGCLHEMMMVWYGMVMAYSSRTYGTVSVGGRKGVLSGKISYRSTQISWRHKRGKKNRDSCKRWREKEGDGNDQGRYCIKRGFVCIGRYSFWRESFKFGWERPWEIFDGIQLWYFFMEELVK